MAYRAIATDRRDPIRYGLLMPALIGDVLTAGLLRVGKLELHRTTAQPMTAQQIGMARVRMLADGGSPKAIEFFLKRQAQHG